MISYLKDLAKFDLNTIKENDEVLAMNILKKGLRSLLIKHLEDR